MLNLWRIYVKEIKADVSDIRFKDLFEVKNCAKKDEKNNEVKSLGSARAFFISSFFQ